MKQYDNTKTVVPEEEIAFMIDYLYQTWDGDRAIIGYLVSEGFNYGYEAAKNWVDQYSFYESIQKWNDERENFLEVDYKDSIHYDQILKISENLLRNKSPYKQMIMKNWDFSKISVQLITKLCETVSKKTIIEILPKGWKKVLDSGKDADDYFNTFSMDEEQLFQGHNSDSAASPGFHGRVNLANTFYDDSEQGRSPLQTLISASFAHGLTTRTHNNEVELLKECETLKRNFNDQKFNKPTYLGNLTDLSDNRIFKALMISKYDNTTKINYHSQEEMDDYLLTLKQKEKEKPTEKPTEPMTEEEKKAKIQQQFARLEKNTNLLLDKINNPTEKEKRKNTNKDLSYEQSILAMLNEKPTKKNKPN